MVTATATAVPHYRGYHVYQRIWTPHGERTRKRTRKWTQLIRSSSAWGQNIVHSLRWVAPFSWLSRTSLHWWFSARFPRCRKRTILPEFVEVVCITHFRLSSLSFLRLTLLLLDSFYRHFCVIFLMLRHSLCCLNFYSCITSHKNYFLSNAQLECLR